jgi:6-pyruvoyltetrahydropterin/6-carboxytetrahydropterin synthase
MISLTRKYVFSASHRLHVDSYSNEQNDLVFGKCNNPFGHGHNYELFVTARAPIDPQSGMAFDPRQLDQLVQQYVLSVYHHKNMNVDVPAYQNGVVPTTENIGLEIVHRLKEHWAEEFPGGSPALEKIRIYETDRNIFEMSAFI